MRLYKDTEMATPVSVEQRSCTAIVWNIVDPGLIDDFYSEDFILDGSLWKFRFVHESYPEIRIYFLKNIDPNEMNRPFVATSHFEIGQQLPKFRQSIEVFNRNFNYNTIWSHRTGLTEEEVKLLSGNVTFVFLCAILADVSLGREHKYVQTSLYMDPVPCFESLSSDFSNLLVGGTKPDVMLKCGDDKIPAHRLVLAARSEMFSSMFSNDMLESRTGSVDIVDMEKPVLDQLLKYLYSGTLPNLDILSLDTAQCLYAAADKYAVQGLKKKCRAFLLENLNEDNVCSLLVFADIHGDKEMKDATTSLFVKNGTLLQDDTWFEICDEHPRLANEVYRVFFQPTT